MFSWASLKQRALSAAVGGSSADADAWSLDELPASFFELTAQDAQGAAVDFAAFRGHPVLAVNVATF